MQASWTKYLRDSDHYFTAETLIHQVHWLIDNTYVVIGDKCFRQKVGIPMGTDCAPFLANLFFSLWLTVLCVLYVWRFKL